MKLKKFDNTIISVALLFTLSGCEVVESLPYIGSHGMGAGAPEVNENGKFSDTAYNRQFFEERVDASINREKNNLLPGHDWQRRWRISFEEIERSSENPEYKKKYIISKRREAGLPIWPFMLK
jgi:hypothetical protein